MFGPSPALWEAFNSTFSPPWPEGGRQTMDKERLSRLGIRPVYGNGWAVCCESMYDRWKTGKCGVFFGFFFASVGVLPAGDMYNF